MKTKKQGNKIEKVYGYRRCRLCKDTIFTGYAFRTKFGRRKAYFCTKNCIIHYKIKRINQFIKERRLHLGIKDYWDNPYWKTEIDKRIKESYEEVFVQNIGGEK